MLLTVERQRYEMPRMAAIRDLALLFGEKITTERKGRIAESAVALRLTILGLRVFRSVADGDAVDFLVINKKGRVVKLQVKWIRKGRYGRPMISLRHAKGERRIPVRYEPGTFDFIVGYSLEDDKAYVFSSKEVSGLVSMVTVTDSSEEAWYKLK